MGRRKGSMEPINREVKTMFLADSVVIGGGFVTLLIIFLIVWLLFFRVR